MVAERKCRQEEARLKERRRKGEAEKPAPSGQPSSD